MIHGRRALVFAAVVAGGSVLAGCEFPTTSGGDDAPEIEFEVQYCEEDGRGNLQNDRCTSDPSRYGGGDYEPYLGGGSDSRNQRGTSR